MSEPKYRVIIEDENGRVRERKDGFLSWEKANKYAMKHTSEKKQHEESCNVQTYWEVKTE
jgi:hypothetical protein